MKVIREAAEMAVFHQSENAVGRLIALVPTMGALHQGHVSLVRAAKKSGQTVVISIFVNPRQFNDPADLENYPRTFEADRILLEEERVDVLFYPSVDEVYSNTRPQHYDMDGLDLGMEGPNRPGHFDGVVQVVSRLFDIVNPHKAYFGEKDFQQLAIIRHMTTKLGYPVQIIGCPTIRESDGVAMSSRNIRLSTEGRKIASAIFQQLTWIKEMLTNGLSPSEARIRGQQKLEAVSGIELEYLELVDPTTLRPIAQDYSGIQACIAAHVDGVRLIDNMRVK